MTEIKCGWCGEPDCRGNCPEAMQVMAALSERDATLIGDIDG